MKKRVPRERDNGFGEWGGYMAAKKHKLQEQFENEAEKGIKVDDLFKNVAIFVNGYTDPSASDLRLLMMRHGGLYHHYYRTGATTHTIASNLPDSKVKQMENRKVVKPEWITDSISAGKVLNYQDYLILTNKSTNQPGLNFPKIKDATDDDFIKDFYSNSRLHYLSTMGNIFKDYVHKLRIENNVKKTNSGNLIMHIDMDCFFVSVGIRDKPELANLPVAVTHSTGNPRSVPGTSFQQELEAYSEKKDIQIDPNHWMNKMSSTDSMSEVASCSYEARKSGVKNGMFVGQALKLCPNLKFIPYDFEAYKEVSFSLYDTIAKYTLDIEAVSCDEMYVDCSQVLPKLKLDILEFATKIRQEIKDKTKCPCSTGFGSNKLLARLATKKAKPDGQFYLEDENVQTYIYSLSVSDLPGVGRSIHAKLKDLEIFTCGDLQSVSLGSLQSDFGQKQGENLYNLSRGIGKGLVFDQVRKSVSADVNYGIRFQNDTERNNFLEKLSTEVASRLESIAMKGKTITLRVMVRSKNAPEETAKFLGHGVCDVINKGTTLSNPTSNSETIYKEVLNIFNGLNLNSKELRGIGIQISKLDENKVKENKLLEFLNKKKPTGPAPAASCSRIIEPRNETPRFLPPVKDEEIAVKEQTKDNHGQRSFVSPSEIRQLITQWVETEHNPDIRDKLMIQNYLLQLVNKWNFEDLMTILKSFQFDIIRNCSLSENWKSCYLDVVNVVQNEMIVVANGRLKLDINF